MRLRSKTLLTLGLVELAVILGVVASFRLYLGAYYEEEAVLDARYLADTAAAALKNAVLASDADTITATAKNLVARPHIERVRVYQNERLLAEVFPGERQSPTLSPGTTEAVAPVQVGSRSVGRVAVALSPGYITKKLNEATRTAVLLGMVWLVASLVLVYGLTRVLTDRVLVLRNAAREIAAGQIGWRVPVTGADEITDTAKAFNQMSASLARETARREEEEGKNSRVREEIEARLHLRTSQALATRRSLESELLEDRVTHLATRALYYDRFRQLRANNPRATLALLLIDVSALRHVSQTFGQPTGDRILSELAQRLRDRVPAPVTVARPGADEFAVLTDTAVAPVSYAQTLLASLTAPVTLLDAPYVPRLRIAIATTKDNGNADTLLENAYRALDTSENEIVTFDAASRAASRFVGAEDLAGAITRQEFAVYYQPRVAASTEWLVGLQALLRWNHPTQGMLDPDAFLPLAQQLGITPTLTRYVIERALTDRKSGVFGELGQVPVTVTVDEDTARSARLPDEIRAMLERTGAKPEWLTLSVSERILIANHLDVYRNLKALHDMGVRIALDDFGTAYACLAYLTHAGPLIDSLQLDRTLILDANTTGSTLEMVDAAIAFAKHHGIKTVAEGIESSDLQTFVEVRGCDVMQGYHIQRPMPTEALRQWLHDRFRKMT